jgi:hypothetical protein
MIVQALRDQGCFTQLAKTHPGGLKRAALLRRAKIEVEHTPAMHEMSPHDWWDAVSTQIESGQFGDPHEVCGRLAQEALADYRGNKIYQKSAELLRSGWRPDRVGLLLLSANSEPHRALRIDDEFRRIQRLHERFAMRERFTLKSFLDLHVSDIPERLRLDCPRVLHFSGHGTPDGSLKMRNDSGAIVAVAPELVAEWIERCPLRPRLIVLNACYSDRLAELLIMHVDCVLGMRTAILDPDANRFAELLYGALFDDDPVHKAFADTITTMKAERRIDADVPRIRGSDDTWRISALLR